MGPYLRYLESSVFDFALLWCMAASFSAVVVSGFWCGDALLANPVLLVAQVGCLLAVLYLLSYSKKTALAAVVAVPCLVIAALAVAAGMWEGEPFEDVAGNPCLALLVVSVATLAAYLLSRKRAGLVVLAALGVLICGYVQFIYKENHVAPAVLFFLSLVVAFAYRYYQSTQLLSRHGSDRFARAFGLCVAGGVAVVALALGAFAVVSAFDPQVIEPKLLREYIALPEVDLRGVADATALDDEDRQSDNNNDQEQYSSNSDDETPEDTQGDQRDGDEGSSSAAPDEVEGFDADADDPSANEVSHELPAIPLAILLVAVLLAAPWAIKCALRRRWRAKVGQMPPSSQVQELYRFFVKRFSCMGLGRASQVTPSEYAAASSGLLDGFTTPDGRDFSDVTEAFERVRYGHHEPTDSQLGLCRAFYESFYRNCKQHLGVIGYARRFFWL